MVVGFKMPQTVLPLASCGYTSYIAVKLCNAKVDWRHLTPQDIMFFLQNLISNLIHLHQALNCLFVAFEMSSNFPIDIKVSIAAITVAICALVISFDQLLEQYFATVDDYRRCQASVMGS